jgi:putative hydrolase of the HAD superfamily
MQPRIWVFDLDDTLHDASTHIFPIMNKSMTQFIMDKLRLDEIEAFTLRQHYWRIYGATLKGLMRHHDVAPQDFLSETHDHLDIENMVLARKRLRHELIRLKGKKVIFTNAPKKYALRVLKVLGIEDLFSLVFSVESTKYHPKPAIRGFRQLLRTLKVNAQACIMLEDNHEALRTAKRLGMKTVWVTRARHKPCYVDYKINHVLALTHVRI